MKKILVGAILMLVMGSQSFAFSDLDSLHWAYNNVMKAQEKGIVSGYDDGTFKPDKPLTREQFITMLTNALGLNGGKSEFLDAKDRWSSNYIGVAGRYLVDDGAKYFKPEDKALREDIAMAIVRATRLENNKYSLDSLNKFSDFLDISDNRKKYIAIASENGLMNGNANGTFNPKRGLTRAEGATVILKLVENN